MDKIDVIFYINLEKRADRNQHFLEEIGKLCTDVSKIRRIDAVYNNIGALGCAKSHIKANEEFEQNPEWETCIIFEDDFSFRNNVNEENNAQLAICLLQNWDIILLAHSCLQWQNTNNDNIKKVISAQTTSGYCLQKRFVPILKKVFQESEKSIETMCMVDYWNAIDIHWKTIQPEHNWFTTIPSLGYQYANFSDVENKDVNYKC